jgi:hypothetical protein
MNKLAPAAAALTAAVMSVSLAAPAFAAVATFTDPADIHHGVDLRKVRVSNGEDNLRITLSHTNLRRSPATGAGGLVFIDTNRRDPGPEYVLTAGLFEGTDYQFLHTDGFAHKYWGKPVNCDYIMRLDYAKDLTRLRFAQDCFGDRPAVRVAVRVSGDRADGAAVVDWLGDPREFTPPVTRG